MSTFMRRFISLIQGYGCIEYLQDHGLLSRQRLCVCGLHMKVQETSTLKDGYLFRCHTCKRKLTIRKDTFFEKSHLRLDVLLELILYFVMKVPVLTAADMTEVSKKTAIQWYIYCRQICATNLSTLNTRLGGAGVIVEIDETVVSKPKYGRGRRSSTVWVFGMYDRSLQKAYFQRVADRSAATLIPVIQRWILPGTTIYSDQWSAYSSLGDLGYVHHTVNHSDSFVDSETGVHTNGVAGYWGRVKRRLKSVYGSVGNRRWDHLDEIQYRIWYKFSTQSYKDNFTLFLKHIKEQYPL